MGPRSMDSVEQTQSLCYGGYGESWTLQHSSGTLREYRNGQPNIDHLRLSSCSSTLGSTARCPRSGLSGLNALRRKNRWPRSVAEKLKKQSVKIVKICEIVKERPSKATALWRRLPCKVFGNPMQSPQSHGRMKMWQCVWPVWRQCEIAITLEHLFSLLRVNLGAPQVMRESAY